VIGGELKAMPALAVAVLFFFTGTKSIANPFFFNSQLCTTPTTPHHHHPQGF
jgi:hypothetical protein